MNEVNYQDIPRKLGLLAMSHFSTRFVSNTIKSTHLNEFNLQLHFSIFVSMRTYEPFWESIMETGFVCSEYILTIARPTHASRAHAIQHFAHTNDLNLAQYYYSFKEAAISSPIWAMFLSFLFHKHTDSVITHESKHSIAMHSVHHLEIFSCRRQSTTLNTAMESCLVWSETCRTSSVVGAPSERHSQLGPAPSAFHSLNDLILLVFDELKNIVKIHVLLKCSYPKKIQNSIKWSSGSSFWILRWESRSIFPKESLAIKQYSIHLFLFSWRFHVSSSYSGAEFKDNRFSILKSTATSRYIPFSWAITTRVSGITVGSRPIAQFTSSNSFKSMKYI